jgi:hypothetical protein
LAELKEMGAEDYTNWNAFAQKVELLNKAEFSIKQKHVADIFEALPNLMAEISGNNQGEEFDGIIQSFRSLPMPNEFGFETGLLYVNYLNLAEFEMKTKQLNTLKNL